MLIREKETDGEKRQKERERKIERNTDIDKRTDRDKYKTEIVKCIVWSVRHTQCYDPTTAFLLRLHTPAFT